jgi:glycosyltransferase involved in cell wall biosynthesis
VGGIEELTRQLSLELGRLGHEPLVLTNRWPDGVVDEEVLDGVAVRRIPFDLPSASLRGLARAGLAAPRSAAAVLRLIHRFRPHVVHAIGAGPTAAYLAGLRPLLGAPVVLTAQGEFRSDPHRAFERSWCLRAGLSHLLRRAAAVTACSAYVLDDLAREFEVRAPATVIPNGVSPADFAGARPSTNGLGRYVFAAGRLVDQKAFDTLLRGYASVRGELGGRRLVLAGVGPDRAALEQLARDLGIGDDVSFVGGVGRHQLAELMRGADSFALPSRDEAFGIALLEAMAAGAPAVASRVGGVPEFASDGENALLVPADDPPALGAALARLANEPALRDRLMTGGRARAEELSWERIAPRYVTIYRQVARA